MSIDFDQVIARRRTACFKWDSLPESPAGELSFLPLNVADMDLPVPDVVVQAMHDVADRRIYGYTSAALEPRYAGALQWWLQRRFSLEVPASSILYANGAVEVIKAALTAFSDPGDGVIIQRPVYGHFTQAIEDECGRKAVSARLLQAADGSYRMDYEALEIACRDPRNKVMVLCSPHNPVGRVWTAEELQKVLEICGKYRVILISDEVHADLLRRGEKHIPLLALAKDVSNIIQINAISKTFNCAGLQCSNAIIPDGELRARFKAALGHVSPTPFALAAQIAAFSPEGEAWLEELTDYVDANIDWVIAYFAKQLPQVRIRRPEGTYLLWLDFRALGLSDDEIHRRIYDDAKVILQDGLLHDPEGGACFQRLVAASPRSMIKEACQRLVTALQAP
ncbi:MAG: putative C-S lyase [Clostridia bacterium]|nr:putative C-S lyase [Clostridia bacterium]NLF21288.1 putative C-S lyase [Clostridiaceae bacterium]